MYDFGWLVSAAALVASRTPRHTPSSGTAPALQTLHSHHVSTRLLWRWWRCPSHAAAGWLRECARRRRTHVSRPHLLVSTHPSREATRSREATHSRATDSHSRDTVVLHPCNSNVGHCSRLVCDVFTHHCSTAAYGGQNMSGLQQKQQSAKGELAMRCARGSWQRSADEKTLMDTLLLQKRCAVAGGLQWQGNASADSTLSLAPFDVQHGCCGPW